MIIVAGHLQVDPAARADYLRDCGAVVEAARAADGCLDFSLAADLVDPGRIAVYERWSSRPELEAFRGSGPSEDQQDAIISADVAEYDVSPG